MITTQIDRSKDLTTHICTGKIGLEDLLAEIKSTAHHESTLDNLWILVDVDVGGLTRNDLRKIAQATKNIAPERVCRKTAIVTKNPMTYGMGRMFQAYAELAGQRSRPRLFRSLADATQWLDERDILTEQTLQLR